MRNENTQANVDRSTLSPETTGLSEEHLGFLRDLAATYDCDFADLVHDVIEHRKPSGGNNVWPNGLD